MKVIAYKGFDKNLKCRDFQYEIGKSYEHKGKIAPCESGFHACVNPIDVWDYYSFDGENRFCEVEISGEIKTQENKSCAAKIKINAELKLPDIIKKTIDFVFQIAKDKSNCYDSQLAASGNYSQLAASGDDSKLESTGQNCILAGIGYNNQAKGIIGNWLVLAEYDVDGKIICVKSGKIDGKKLKADTWYYLKNKKFTEVK